MTQTPIPKDAFDLLNQVANNQRSAVALAFCSILSRVFRNYNDTLVPAGSEACTCPIEGTWLRMDDYRAFTHEMDKLLHGANDAAKAPTLGDILHSMRERGTSSDKLDAQRWRWWVQLLTYAGDESAFIRVKKFCESIDKRLENIGQDELFTIGMLNEIVDKQRRSEHN